MRGLLDRLRASPVPARRRDTLRTTLEGLISDILERGDRLVLDGSYVREIGDVVASDSLDAKSAEQLLAERFAPDRRRALDYGCGAGAHRGFIESLGYGWRGVDCIGTVSPSVVDEVAAKGEVTFYDGRRLPFDDAQFDVVYAMLVLHHVQRIDESFGEIARVLARGGAVIGQVSYLEQMQDYGTFNFTPFGLKVVAANAGLRLTQIHPKHDAFSFLFRRLLITLGSSDDTELNAMMNPDGFYHRAVIQAGARLGLSVREINLLRLQFCTHFVFQLEKQP